MTIKYQIERQCYKDRKKRHTKVEPMINLYDTLEDAILAGLKMPKTPCWTGIWIVKRITIDEPTFYYKKERVVTGV